MNRAKAAIGAALVVVLAAGGCRTETTVRAAPIEPTVSSLPTAVAEPTSVTPPAPAPDPTAPAAGATVEPAAPATFVLPEAFVAPPGWNEPLPRDDRIVEGALSNGLRYLIQENDSPGGQAQLRLVVAAGSLHEATAGSGVAHFLEHMMFNGTERFPGNEIVSVLEGFGSGFGPDVNAYTSFEETVYELTVPARDTATLQLGLDVLAEWASKATLDSDAVVAERGVVREERRRTLESAGGRLGEELRGVLFDGTAYRGRDPIGTAASIDSMTADDLIEFYETWYRPELMTVVAVGDFDSGDMERRVGDTFGDLPQSASRPAPIEVGGGPLADPVFDVYVDPELTRTEVQVGWRVDATPISTRMQGRQALVQAVTMLMLDTRLAESVQRASSVFLTAGGGYSGLTSSLAIVALTGSTDPDRIGAGLQELVVEAERARQYGLGAAEFERAISQVRASIEQSFAESSTRQDFEIASALVDYALHGEIPLAPDDDIAISTEVLDSLTTGDSQLFVDSLLNAAPYVLVLGPADDTDLLAEPEEFADLYQAALGARVDAFIEDEDTTIELMSRPDAVAVIDTRSVSALDTTVVTFENGVRMALRQSSIVENLVQFQAASIGGFFAVDGPEVPLLGWASSMVLPSGFAGLDAVTIDRLLAGSVASLGANIGRAEEFLDGAASPEDLELLFQLIHLQMTEPALDDLQVRRFEDIWRPRAEHPESEPQIAADLELWKLRYGSSPWFRRAPTVEDLDNLDPELLLAAWKDRFANAADFVFVFVGDLDPDELIDLGSRYLGTLPATDDREVAIDRDPGIPEDNLVATVAAGIGDQGLLLINWESPFTTDLESRVAAAALDLVVDARLRDLIREQLGASYAPSANVVVLDQPKPWIDTTIEVAGDPARLAEVSAEVRAELARLRAGDIDPGYLERAVDQLVEGYRFSTNQDWIELITDHLRNPGQPADLYQRRGDVAAALDIDDLASVARAAFPPSRSVEIRLVPAT